MLLKFNDTIINTKHLRGARYSETPVGKEELRLYGYDAALLQNPNLRGLRVRLEMDFACAGQEVTSVYAGDTARKLWKSLCALSRTVNELADEVLEESGGSGDEIVLN